MSASTSLFFCIFAEIIKKHQLDFGACHICPRSCGANRRVAAGFCHAPSEPEIASICVHKGEEPPISGAKGICNLFFAHCNLQCVFCQNHDISGTAVDKDKIFYKDLDSVVDRIAEVLQTSENMLGFVSPSHYAYVIPELMERLHERRIFPTTVYNTNGYDDVETLQMVEPYVDIYLPDLKYMDSALAQKYSHAADYPEKAAKALQEMFRQKGSALPCDDGVAFRGIIIRHLVLPGAVENSIKCLEWIADNLSTNLHISLMSQYFPPKQLLDGSMKDFPELTRTMSEDEYEQVKEKFYALGFHKGWVQELASNESFRPDFSKKEAFGN